jgi:hypothetical protein
MLAGSDEDELFGEVPQQQEVHAPVTSSAILEWEREKRQEIDARDRSEAEYVEEMKAKAKKGLAAHLALISENQTKAAKHNIEVDKQTLLDQGTKPDNSWERVVKYIDFNRSDLHQRDVGKMKSLLLQLKH